MQQGAPKGDGFKACLQDMIDALGGLDPAKIAKRHADSAAYEPGVFQQVEFLKLDWIKT